MNISEDEDMFESEEGSSAATGDPSTAVDLELVYQTSTPAIFHQTPPRPRLSSPVEDGSPVFRSQRPARVRRPRLSQVFDDPAPPIETVLQDDLPAVVAASNNVVPTPPENDLVEPGTAELIEGQVGADNPSVPEDLNIPQPEDLNIPQDDIQIVAPVSSSSHVIIEAQHNDSGAEFQPGPSGQQFDSKKSTKPAVNPEKEKTKKSKTKKRKAADSVDEDDDDDGSCCTICFESWSNSGEHRIASLKCGHFFGYACIEKWLRGSGASCPNCKEKCTKKDIRVHYVAKLKAIDTSEKDRALHNLELTKVELRELQLRHTELQVRLQLQSEQVDKLSLDIKRYRDAGGELPPLVSNVPSSQAGGGGEGRLVYQKRHEICKPSAERDKCCRVMAYCQPLGMLVVSQPSFTALAPGFGVRRYSMLDQKLGNFVGVHREIIRELVFHPTQHELLLSCGQDKTARITNMSTCQEVTRFTTDSEVWAAEWSHSNANIVFLGTKRSQILIYDTRDTAAPPTTLTFPGTERRPIISLKFVPACPARGFPFPGLLAMTLGSLWFWAHHQGTDWVAHRLPLDAKLLWAMEFEPESRLVLVSCRPAPQAVHLILELGCTRVESGDNVVTCRTVLKQTSGGSYSTRSFLRSTLISAPNGQALLVFGRGTGQTDHRVIVQEVGSERVVQELNIGRPVLDLCQATINGDRHLAVLGETELTMYKWQ